MRVIFSKMASERKLSYQIATLVIKNDDGTCNIIKKAMTPHAIHHIQCIRENADILSHIYGNEHVAQCKQIADDALSFSFVEGRSLLETLRQAFLERNQQDFRHWIDFYEKNILRGNDKGMSVGDIQINPLQRSENIDLTFDNIILTDNHDWCIIDYEWLTSNISKNYVRMRAISGFLTRAGLEQQRLQSWMQDNYPDCMHQISSPDFQMRERSFYEKVLVFPHEQYKKPILSLDALLEQEKEKIREEKKQEISALRGEILEREQKISKLRQSNHELQLQNRSLQTEQQKHLATLQDCHAYLQEIEGSRGYRLVKRYYHLRDCILPRGSRRRLLVKSVAWGLIHPRVMVSLLTRENLRKAWAAWRIGGFAQFLSRADGKLHSPAVQEISCETGEETRAHNRWLAESPAAILPAGTVIDLVVPVYNAPDFTKRCLASVLANTDADYRLIVIDDCSTDPAIADILEDFRSRGGEGHLQEMQILRNERNLGFIGTVNRAFSLAKHHVVLLNTDTEVPPGWLSRLVRPLFGGERIATVTPFSNSAEICSFPRMAENNDLPEGMDVAAVDAVFRRYGDTSAVEIPTGVGFAMAISQECLKSLGGFDTAFGKGYGEENDFCRRAAAAGWKNVQVRDLFIYHKHGASFATRTDASKAERLAKNLAIINQRYPGYDRMIQEYIAKDPCRAERTFLAAVIRARQGHTAGKHGVLFLNHSLGGGTQAYQDGKIKERLGEERVYSACVLADGRTLIVREHSGENALPGMEIARFDYAGMTEPMYKSLLAALLVDEIFVNHLIGFRLPEFLDWNERCGVPYRVFLHDFFCVCPRYTLLNDKGEYCGAETDETVCARCLAKGDSATQDIHTWRGSMQRFLVAAADVSAPSRSTAEIVERYYEDLTVEVKEHRLPAPVHPTYQASFREDPVRTVAVLGAIGPAKGVEIVYALKRRIEKENAPIRLVVIGYTSLQNEAYRDPSGKFEITGPYPPEMISDLLAKYRVNLVLIPSIWPETFSYTTSEAIASGYPVAAFDLGAPAERIKRLQAGWVVPLESGAEGMWRKICEAVG